MHNMRQMPFLLVHDSTSTKEDKLHMKTVKPSSLAMGKMHQVLKDHSPHMITRFLQTGTSKEAQTTTTIH